MFYRLWCGLFVLLYSSLVTYEVLIARGVVGPNLGLIDELTLKADPAERDQLFAEKRRSAVGGAIFGGCGALFYAVAAFVPRRPWGWVIGLLAIIGSILPWFITAAGAVPLLMAWQKPEMKNHFSRPKLPARNHPPPQQ